MDISAVIQSRTPVVREIPGVTSVYHVGVYKTAAEMYAARLAALCKVQTKWFFYLDDDDSLPEDYERILKLCMAVPTKLAYTNELVIDVDGSTRVKRPRAFTRAEFRRDPLLFHHLVVCDTEVAQRVSHELPRGVFLAETMLFGLSAYRFGATHIDDVGYVWRRGGGLHSHPDTSFALNNSLRWVYSKMGATS